MSFAIRTLRSGAELPGWRVVGERVLREAGGGDGVAWLLDEPMLRDWSANGVLTLTPVPGWRLEQREEGAALGCADARAEADLVELHGAAAEAFEHDASAAEPMTVIPSFRPLAGPADLGRYLVGGRVVTGGPRGRWQVEQAALSIYRIARLRGGAFWEGVAAHAAAAVAQRVEEAPGGRPVTDHWGEGEVHARFVADAALLLAAHAELSGDSRYGRAAERAADAIESFGVAFAGGRWYLHDSVEQEAGRNDLVLNTHLHSITALRACGRDVSGGLRALDAVLAKRPRGARALAAGAGLAATDLLRAFPLRRIPHRPVVRAHERLARLAARERALLVPGGFVARDASGARAPSTYLAVNLSDLAVLQRNTPTPRAAAALARGLRYTRRFAYMQAELRDERPAAQVLMPHALRNAGDDRGARAAAARATNAGLAPIPGWPGYEDALWSRLAQGTP